MANILEQMVQDGYNSDSEKDTLIRYLAHMEDRSEAGELDLDPDEIAEVRHYIMFN